MGDSRRRLDISVPAAARRYDVWLGGKDNYAADRDSAATIAQAFPPMPQAVRENRRCLLRMVDYLARECGVRQFIDVGCGMPSRPNVHEVAQTAWPAARIVYVDHDPLVAVHARALMTGGPDGVVAVHEGDVTDAKEIVSADLVRDTIDFSEPVGVLLFAVLHFVTDDDIAARAVRTLVEAVPAGSYVGLSHASFDLLDGETSERLAPFTRPDSPHGPFRPRTHQAITGFVDGLELLKPGVVVPVLWRPELEPQADPRADPVDGFGFAVLARKP